MKKFRIARYISFLLLALIVFSCSSSDKSDIKTDDPDEAMKIAMKNYDKREDIAKRDADKKMQQAMKKYAR